MVGDYHSQSYRLVKIVSVSVTIADPGFELPVVSDSLQSSPRNWTGTGAVWVIRSGRSVFGGIFSSEGK